MHDAHINIQGLEGRKLIGVLFHQRSEFIKKSPLVSGEVETPRILNSLLSGIDCEVDVFWGSVCYRSDRFSIG